MLEVLLLPVLPSEQSNGGGTKSCVFEADGSFFLGSPRNLKNCLVCDAKKLLAV